MSLKQRLPAWEADYILPLWLLLTIAAAAFAETVVIGYGIQIIYDGLWIGWPVGFTVASAQALGSQLYAYNVTHNATRYIRWRTRKVRGEPVRYESQHESEPRFNTWQPLAVSLVAGVLAAGVALALYGRMNGGLTFLNWAVSLASPVASISAALLNGLFASGELALRRFREEAEQDEKPALKPQEPAKPAESEAPEPAPIDFECGQCHRTFSTVQALNAHRRFCAGSEAGTNGNEPAREREEQEHEQTPL